MPHELLLFLYISAFIAQIVFLIRCWKINTLPRWLTLYTLEIGSIIAAFSIMYYYNEHPGYMLSTLGHVLWSMGAAAVFCFTILITIIVHILRANVFKSV